MKPAQSLLDWYCDTPEAKEKDKIIPKHLIDSLMKITLIPFINSIISDLELHGYSQCFTHAHTIREQHAIARTITMRTGMRIAVELNVGLVEVVL